MAKHEGKNTDRPISKKARAKATKKGFFATLFEPVAQDPDADFFYEDPFDELDTSESEAQLHGLLQDDDADGNPVAQDSDAVERITFEEGAPVITDIPYENGAYGKEFSARPQPATTDDEDAYSILKNSFNQDEPDEPPAAEGAPVSPEDAESIQASLNEALTAPNTIELTAESVIIEEPPEPIFTPPSFLSVTPTPGSVADTEMPPDYVPLTSTIDAADSVPVAQASPETAPTDEADSYVPLTSAIDASATMVPYTPQPTEAPMEAETGYVALTSAIDAGTGMAPYAPTGMAPTTPPATEISEVPPSEWLRYASGSAQDSSSQPISLFDDDNLTDTERQRRQTTRLFRTGTSATTRIHINETEEAIRREEAARRAEAREAKRKQDAAMERRNKKKTRSSILRGLFANLAFVLFFIAAVVVALYYGFLLSDIVVMGNVQYTSDYIVQESGLKYGTHMLFCNLDEAKENISANPYIQVDSVTYIFPNRIRIIVSERKEVAGIAGLDYNVIIDDQGYVLSMSPSTDLSGLLQVSGVSMTGFRLGQRLGEGNDFSTATLIEIIGKLEQYELIDDVTSIDLTTPLAIRMQAKNGLTIHVGQGTDLDAKMAILAKLLPRFVEQSIGIGTLYLSAKGGAVYSPPYAASNAQPVTTDNTSQDIPIATDDPNFIDDDGDGLDDVTGMPAGQTATPMPGATPTPTPAPTAYIPGGGADDFSG